MPRGRPVKDMRKKRVGRWRVLDAEPLRRGRRLHWLCRCRCGLVRYVAADALARGATGGCARCGHPGRKKDKALARRLRERDPAKWSYAALGRKFGVSKERIRAWLRGE